MLKLQELPVADREVGAEVREVLIDGVKLDSNSPINTLRGACRSLGLSQGGGKVKLLRRLWEHLQSQELIAAHSAQRNLEGDQMRPAIGQTVPSEPTDAQRAQHNLTHYPYAAWCELCVAHHARQDGHEPQPHVESGHICISFDFGYAARNDEEDKLCALFLHDRHTGAMHVVPTPQKGGRWLNHLCTEFCRFILLLGHPTISLKYDQEDSTLSLLDAVRCLGVKTIVETVAPGSHASNGAAEVTLKLLRRHANLLIQQVERGCGIPEGTIGCQQWMHGHFFMEHGCITGML